jgi:sec-independent protein translocase protein TatA
VPSLSPVELIIVLVVILLVVGPKKLPDAGRGLGKGLREFKEGITGERSHAELAGAKDETAS